MDMNNSAKVFGEGDVTIVINMQAAAARIYVGSQLVGFVQKLKLELDLKEPRPQLEFAFPQSHDANTSMRIEEHVRMVKQQVPWAKVIR